MFVLLHLDRLIDLKDENIAVREMRKHAAWYLKGIRGNAKFVMRSIKCETGEDLSRIIRCICRRSEKSETLNSIAYAHG